MKIASAIKTLAIGIMLVSSSAFAKSGQYCNDWIIEYNTATGSLDDLIKEVKVQTSTEVPSLEFRKIGKYMYATSYNPTEDSNQKEERAKAIKVLNYIQKAGYSVTCDQPSM